MNNSERYSGARSRVHILLSLAVIVFSFALVSAQSGLASLKPSDQPVPAVANSGIATSYADLVS